MLTPDAAPCPEPAAPIGSEQWRTASLERELAALRAELNEWKGRAEAAECERERMQHALSSPVGAVSAVAPSPLWSFAAVEECPTEVHVPPPDEDASPDEPRMTVPYPARKRVTPENVPWSQPMDGYAPLDHTDPSVHLHASADPDNPRDIPDRDWELRRHRTSLKRIHFDHTGRPMNPIGRTGLRGRGVLHYWGPNFTVDLLVTRVAFKDVVADTRADAAEIGAATGSALPGQLRVAVEKLPEVSGVLDVLARERFDVSDGARSWQLLGGCLGKQDGGSAREQSLPLHHVQRLASVFVAPTVDARWRVQVIETIARFLGDDSTWPAECRRWVTLTEEYVEDSRSTDNAWLETRVMWLHLGPTMLEAVAGALVRGVGPAVAAAVLSEFIGEVWCPNSPMQRGLRWLEVDSEGGEDFHKLARHHGACALLAHSREFPMPEAKPLATSNIFFLVGAGWAQLEADLGLNITAAVREKLEHITFLVDDHDWPTLLDSLWRDAGKPSETAAKFPETVQVSHCQPRQQQPQIGHPTATPTATQPHAVATCIAHLLAACIAHLLAACIAHLLAAWITTRRPPDCLADGGARGGEAPLLLLPGQAQLVALQPSRTRAPRTVGGALRRLLRFRHPGARVAAAQDEAGLRSRDRHAAAHPLSREVRRQPTLRRRHLQRDAVSVRQERVSHIRPPTRPPYPARCPLSLTWRARPLAPTLAPTLASTVASTLAPTLAPICSLTWLHPDRPDALGAGASSTATSPRSSTSTCALSTPARASPRASSWSS